MEKKIEDKKFIEIITSQIDLLRAAFEKDKKNELLAASLLHLLSAAEENKIQEKIADFEYLKNSTAAITAEKPPKLLKKFKKIFAEFKKSFTADLDENNNIEYLEYLVSELFSFCDKIRILSERFEIFRDLNFVLLDYCRNLLNDKKILKIFEEYSVLLTRKTIENLKFANSISEKEIDTKTINLKEKNISKNATEYILSSQTNDEENPETFIKKLIEIKEKQNTFLIYTNFDNEKQMLLERAVDCAELTETEKQLLENYLKTDKNFLTAYYHYKRQQAINDKLFEYYKPCITLQRIKHQRRQTVESLQEHLTFINETAARDTFIFQVPETRYAAADKKSSLNIKEKLICDTKFYKLNFKLKETGIAVDLYLNVLPQRNQKTSKQSIYLKLKDFKVMINDKTYKFKKAVKDDNTIENKNQKKYSVEIGFDKIEPKKINFLQVIAGKKKYKIKFISY